ncbi:hypothetical protein [Streptomyces erythrochromogenes]|uniref:hypothetical protein n=1 Tax=Streptomyces erythrochromogenes TaxID=285574 RepID=UPI00369A06A2
MAVVGERVRPTGHRRMRGALSGVIPDSGRTMSTFQAARERWLSTVVRSCPPLRPSPCRGSRERPGPGESLLLAEEMADAGVSGCQALTPRIMVALPLPLSVGERPTSRRKGLPDGAMFSRNTWLTRQAFDALGSDDRYRLYRLEDVILDRAAVWPGCGGTLTDFGWGFLGEIQKHVKKRIDQFAYFEEVLEPEDFLVFAGAPQIGTHTDRYGRQASAGVSLGARIRGPGLVRLEPCPEQAGHGALRVAASGPLGPLVGGGAGVASVVGIL